VNVNPTQTPGPVFSLDVAPTDAVVEPEGFATCPTCHVVDAVLTNASLAAGGYWRCERCGSKWDQTRLATVAAYAAWDLARQHRKPGAEPMLVRLTRSADESGE
jgi:hypothetical protein